jgi:biotin transport system substrate-specific component
MMEEICMKLKTKDMILVALFTALTAVGAFINIPIGPAPISLQFLFTALAAILLGSRLGALSQAVYVALGLIGIPIFTGGGGISYIFKPTFGYLIGFIIGCYIIGKLSEKIKRKSFIKLFLSVIAGIAVIYLIGVPYMYLVLKYVMGVKITILAAIKAGFIVFIPGDILKSLIAAGLGVKLIPIVRTNYRN